MFKFLVIECEKTKGGNDAMPVLAVELLTGEKFSLVDPQGNPHPVFQEERVNETVAEICTNIKLGKVYTTRIEAEDLSKLMVTALQQMKPLIGDVIQAGFGAMFEEERKNKKPGKGDLN